MSLLVLDKIEQLRVQLEQCTNLHAASTFRIAISRLESQLQLARQEPFHSETEEVILKSLIDNGSVQIYQPTTEKIQLEPKPSDLSEQSCSVEHIVSDTYRNSVRQHVECKFADQGEEFLFQSLIKQGRVKVYPPISLSCGGSAEARDESL